MVEWMMVLMDFGCMVFIAKTALEHVYHVREVQPQVAHMLSRADAFEARTEEEIGLRTEARGRLSDLRTSVRDSERELEGVRRELNASYKTQEDLESAAHQSQFRQGVRDGRRVHHAVAAAD